MRPLLLALLIAVPASAQTLPSWAAPPEAAGPSSALSSAGDDPPAPPGRPTPVPLDGGAALLALAGAAYAARRLR